MKTTSFAISVMFVVSVFVVTTGVAEDGSSGPDEQVIHTTVPRLDAVAVGEAELDETTEASDALVALRQERLLHGRQHPEAGPPFEVTEVDPATVRPHTPATDPVDGESRTAPVELFVNSTPSDAAPVSYSSVVNEPAVAAAGNRAFYTANWYSAASVNGGTNFSFVSPFPGPYPNPSGESFCCDQTMAHDPGTNTIFWLQQFIPNSFNPPSSTTGTQRINVDLNADGSWDCAYDITTVLVGFATQTWFDFPDLTVSGSYLYHSSNAFTYPGGWAGGYVGRYPLAELTSCATPLSIDGYRTVSHGSFRLTRGASDTMYFGAQPNTSAVRVWTWPDGDPSPSSVLRSISPWLDQNRVCPGPDGRNWCGFHDGRIQGAFLSGSTVGFMWSPSQGGSFPFPYVRIATFDAGNDMSLLDEVDIWSSDVAYMYPSASVNVQGQLGGTVMWGGGTTHYPSCSAWMADTPTAADFAPLQHTTSIAGTTGPDSSGGRSGDYTMSNRYYPDGSQFVGACFAYRNTGTGTSTFVRFGHVETGEIFSDDFESGGVGNWSQVAP